MLLYNMKTIKDIFGKYSGKFSLPGDKMKCMSCIEFVELIDQLRILADTKEKEAPAKKAQEQKGKEDVPKGVQKIKDALLQRFEAAKVQG